ncbi:hypothetical protein [Methyloceanibacter sp.]|uniref:hypothetical protein n=1 Tax=Methyloceanibacter sp. TaxID=1965321 RepID=UPI002D4558FB|nr:hypothetical protein [Methyloceanibacter sp.]HZP10526.1 hypothetical protein [Methyloceanibacter sp.]
MVITRPSLARLALAAAVFALLPLAASPASAKKKPPEPAVEENAADLVFAKSFVGKTYDDELDIEGWEDLGGGLVSPPVYVHEYRREDGALLVLTSKETTPQKGDMPGSYVVLDALIVSKLRPDAVLSVACVQGADQTLRFIGEARGSDQKEWWTDVSRAWEISLETGAITPIKPKGVKCTNPTF